MIETELKYLIDIDTYNKIIQLPTKKILYKTIFYYDSIEKELLNNRSCCRVILKGKKEHLLNLKLHQKIDPETRSIISSEQDTIISEVPNCFDIRGIFSIPKHIFDTKVFFQGFMVVERRVLKINELDTTIEVDKAMFANRTQFLEIEIENTKISKIAKTAKWLENQYGIKSISGLSKYERFCNINF